ncbi:phosphoesterase [Campylobacter sputorum]|uniref:phosphoesterase n=1 Tax=Campylobacter sputorum TaxID=206 RepID=UPI000B78395B|nr:phosphoesterase [Campylobacter sputorum]ASM37150.1 metallophosphatase [Campylobacter sputorum bv. faecalis CCUG 20703]
MSKVFFTSDLHFGHNKIMQFCPAFRRFETTLQMDEALINLWNTQICKDDIIYDLGDFSFHKNLNDIKKVLRRLDGHHILVLGNHDQIIRDNKDELLNGFKNDGNKMLDEITDYKEISLQDSKENWHKFVLFHYPLNEWNKGHYGTILLYGHLHDELASIKGKALNVSYDLHGNILSIDEVLEYVKDIEPFLHHKSKVFGDDDLLEIRKILIKNKLKRINFD